MFGTVSTRCMSLASSPAPCAVRAPPTAKALLPERCSQGMRTSDRRAGSSGTWRRSIAAGPGSGAACGAGEPSSGAASAESTGARKSAADGPNSRASASSAAS